VIEYDNRNNWRCSYHIASTPQDSNFIMESITPTSAQAKVFEVPELLEGIIAFLPERDILTRVQRVSRTWKTTVDESLSIQQQIGRRKRRARRATPIETPTRIADVWTDDEPEDLGIPIYKAPIPINSMFMRATDLYQDCTMGNSIYFARNWSNFLEPNWSKHTIRIESSKSEDHPNGRPAFSNNPDFSWRPIQICDPPITVARLHTYGGEKLWHIELFGLTGVFTTIFDKDGITLGLVHDTAAATLRSHTDGEDPRLGWHLDLSWGTEDSPESHAMWGVDESDAGEGIDYNDRSGEDDLNDRSSEGEDGEVDELGDRSGEDHFDDLPGASEDGGVANGGQAHDGGEEDT
jgi:hypothetical protein